MRYVSLLICLVLLSACGGGESSSDSKSGMSATEAAVPAEKTGGVIPAGQLRALDKAKGMEGMLAEAEQQRREQMDAQE